jgi:predicted nucleic acid-binding protein
VARIILDTNVYILGFQRRAGDEWLTLQRVRRRHDVIVFSRELEDQIRRVGRRVGGKDYIGLILNAIWRNFTVDYVLLPDEPFKVVQQFAPSVPTEDALVFLTAVLGRAECLVSANREFLRCSAAAQRVFRCLTPAEFLTVYL